MKLDRKAKKRKRKKVIKVRLSEKEYQFLMALYRKSDKEKDDYFREALQIGTWVVTMNRSME